MSKITWTKDKLKKAAAGYTTRGAFSTGNRKAYKSASAKGLLDEICAHMVPARMWPTDKIYSEALKYKTRAAFKAGTSGAYAQAHRDGIIDEVCSHMEVVFTYWTEEMLQEEALKYISKKDFVQANAAAYRAAYTRGLIAKICAHMPTRGKKWEMGEILETLSLYSSIEELKQRNQMLYKHILANSLNHLLDPLKKLVAFTMEPSLTGVYILKNGEDVIYIGKSNSCVRGRVIAHLRDKQFDRVEILQTTGIADTDVLEIYLINKYKPKHNKDNAKNSTLTIEITNLSKVVLNTKVYIRRLSGNR